MSKEILLTRGQVALVDDVDYDWLSQFKWYASYSSFVKSYYASGWAGGGDSLGRIAMHRFIMQAKPGIYVDHINHDTLDNTRSNLRLCTKAQNGANRRLNSTSTSGYKGVTWVTRAEKWTAHIRVNYKLIHLGYYTTPVDAALAYDEVSRKLYGEFALTNENLGLLITSE
jgi:hypothetical protein